jgi:pSer/pThr/pTyr-binding forkhead associated (FHA) protein
MKLVLQSSQKEFPLTLNKPVTVGRALSCTISFPEGCSAFTSFPESFLDLQVSSKHLLLTTKAYDQTVLIDSSTNGTCINGTRVLRNVETPVCIGDTLTFGLQSLKIEKGKK